MARPLERRRVERRLRQVAQSARVELGECLDNEGILAINRLTYTDQPLQTLTVFGRRDGRTSLAIHDVHQALRRHSLH